MLDKYFKHPVTIDYFFGALSSSIIFYFYMKGCFSLPKEEIIVSITSDLSTVSLTFAGFILTLLTVLITFKTGAKIPTDENQELIPLFDIFFSTPLYFDTIVLLKNAIKSLIVLAMVGYSLKLILRGDDLKMLFFYNIILIEIITLTLWRNLAILGLILKLQKKKPAAQ